MQALCSNVMQCMQSSHCECQNVPSHGNWHLAALPAMGPGSQPDVLMRSHEHLWLPSRFLPLVPAAITYPMAWFYMSPAKWFWYLW